MAQKIDLSSPEQRELFGLTESLSIGSQRSKKRQEPSYRGREESRRLILHACHHREMTIREIAKELDRSKSPQLRVLVYELCQEQLLTARQDQTPNGLTVYKFIAH